MDEARQAYLKILKDMIARGLPLKGWKIGVCSYCQNTSFPDAEVVMVHRLPNKLFGCMTCYKRPNDTVRKGSKGNRKAG